MHTFSTWFYTIWYVLFPQSARCRYFICNLNPNIIRPWWNSISIIIIPIWSCQWLFQIENSKNKIKNISRKRRHPRRRGVEQEEERDGCNGGDYNWEISTYTIFRQSWSKILCLQSHGGPNFLGLFNLWQHCWGSTFAFLNEFVLSYKYRKDSSSQNEQTKPNMQTITSFLFFSFFFFFGGGWGRGDVNAFGLWDNTLQWRIYENSDLHSFFSNFQIIYMILMLSKRNV